VEEARQGLQELEVSRMAHHDEVQEAFRVVRGAFRVRVWVRAAPQVWVLHVWEPRVQQGLHKQEPLAQRVHEPLVLDIVVQAQRAWVPFGGPFREQLHAFQGSRV